MEEVIIVFKRINSGFEKVILLELFKIIVFEMVFCLLWFILFGFVSVGVIVVLVGVVSFLNCFNLIRVEKFFE